MKELVLYVFTETENFKGVFNRFEVHRGIQDPVWITNSVFFMDHDSSGRCYCRGYPNSRNY